MVSKRLLRRFSFGKDSNGHIDDTKSASAEKCENTPPADDGQGGFSENESVQSNGSWYTRGMESRIAMTAVNPDGCLFGDARKLVISYILKSDRSDNAMFNPAKSKATLKAKVQAANMNFDDCLALMDQEGMDEGILGHDSELKQKGLLSQYEGSRVHYVSVPHGNIDARESISIVADYVAAYRVLNRTAQRPIRRFDKVMVTNAHTSLGQAIIKLAKMAEASSVFGVVSPKYATRVKKCGATPLNEENTGAWVEYLRGSVDIVIDIGASSVEAPLTVNTVSGKLVRVHMGAFDENTVYRTNNSKLSAATHHYNLYRDMESDVTSFRWDLQNLFNLLHEGVIKLSKQSNGKMPLMGLSYIEVRFEQEDENPQARTTNSSQPSLKANKSEPNKANPNSSVAYRMAGNAVPLPSNKKSAARKFGTAVLQGFMGMPPAHDGNKSNNLFGKYGPNTYQGRPRLFEA
uniref:Enoyl reductase (ER) domain-containing protein n=1 Tax=Attheya septentrionalis TaxID=420275 RepID=A0A7S2U9C7_9STRA|mmetsp:Transcript_13492/g.24428  ORF Transcript_13492/g.24428 Transcript_13492/m.24428 type:complete len:462 (+) Transcript_13492:208-1593(+)